MYQQPQFQPPLFDQNYLMQLFRGYIIYSNFRIELVNQNSFSLRADRDGSGVINANELQGLLSHGSWNQFNLQTVK